MAKPMHQKLPNILTMVRLLLALGFFLILTLAITPESFAHRQSWGNIALGVFIFAALTDFLDGYLARKWDVVSVFGRIMDPFCDKVLVLGAFIYLASPRLQLIEDGQLLQVTGVHAWMVVIIFSRELLVTSIRAFVESRGISFAADWPGKIKMILQSIAIPLCLLTVMNRPLLELDWLVFLRDALVWVTVLFTAISVVPYITRAMKILDHPGTDQGESR